MKELFGGGAMKCWRQNPFDRFLCSGVRSSSWLVAEIVQERFGNNLKGRDFVVLGDLNSGPDAEERQPALGAQRA